MCVAIPPTNSKSAGPGKVWLWLTDAPWRFLLAGGLFSLALAGLLTLFGKPVGLYFVFAVWPFFVTALVLTVAPRWLGHDVTYDYSFLKNIAALVPAAVLMLLHVLTGWVWSAVVAALLVTVSYLLLSRHLYYMLSWSVSGDKTIAWLTLGFVAVGLVASVMLLLATAAGSASEAVLAKRLMGWFSTTPLLLIFVLKFLADGSSPERLMD